MFSKTKTSGSMKDFSKEIQQLKKELETADAVIIGAGAGLSTSAGFTYSAERFEKNFADFKEKYKFEDMYSGGFYPFETREEFWAFWSRNIFVNRYTDTDNGTYKNLLKLVKNKDYFVLTTNVDHQFQKAGFDKHKLFYTQGDYGLFQCSRPCCQKTYDNEEQILKMVKEQKDMKIPSELIPRCPICSSEMTTNLRCDDRFVQDEGWYAASERYTQFLARHKGLKLLFLELGVGYNTPGIIKYPFLREVYENKNAVYACINFGQAGTLREIKDRSICINADIGEVLKQLL